MQVHVYIIFYFGYQDKETVSQNKVKQFFKYFLIN